MSTDNLKSFHYLENGEISFSTFNTVKSASQLDSGVYRIDVEPSTRLLSLHQDSDIEMLPIHSFGEKEKLDSLFKSFFNQNIISRMRELGILHKVGVLLHGKEGTGKSTIMKYYYNNFVRDHNALVFHIAQHSDLDKKWTLIQKIRKIQKNPIVIVFDEFDGFFYGSIQSVHNETQLKSMIDGKLSIDNVIILASTNYFDRIPYTIKDRPSRFKYCLNIETINNDDFIFSILQNMLLKNYTEPEIRKMAKGLSGQTLDNVKQHALDKLMEIKSYTSSSRKTIGFKSKVEA